MKMTTRTTKSLIKKEEQFGVIYYYTKGEINEIIPPGKNINTKFYPYEWSKSAESVFTYLTKNSIVVSKLNFFTNGNLLGYLRYHKDNGFTTKSFSQTITDIKNFIDYVERFHDFKIDIIDFSLNNSLTWCNL
jgi:hypothetical protein